MIGVVIPVHNEEAELGGCLSAVLAAATWHERALAESVRVLVVLDSCRDASQAIARRNGVEVLVVGFRNVGQARAAGACLLLAAGARWLAFTDADTHVAPDWLSIQTSLGADATVGTIAVRDWAGHAVEVQRKHDQMYANRDGHRHIHGANLGVSAAAYRAVGGFRPLVTGEDVALVDALEAAGARIAWSAAPRVFTSSRTCFRAPDGFGAMLLRLSESLAPVA